MRAYNISTIDMIEHHSVKNLIVGAIVVGINRKVEVFNPLNQRVCEMPDLPGDDQFIGFHLFII